jgi:hypothetical protein
MEEVTKKKKKKKKRDFLSLNNPQKIWGNFVPQQGVDVGVQGLQG